MRWLHLSMRVPTEKDLMMAVHSRLGCGLVRLGKLLGLWNNLIWSMGWYLDTSMKMERGKPAWVS